MPSFQKRSETSKRLWSDPKYKEKMSLIRKKLWEDTEFRVKMCKSIIEGSKRGKDKQKRICSQTRKDKLKEAWKRRKESSFVSLQKRPYNREQLNLLWKKQIKKEKEKRHIRRSAAAKRVWNSLSYEEKKKVLDRVHNSNIGRKHSIETKLKMRVAHLGKRWSSEESKKNMSEVLRKRWSDSKFKDKMNRLYFSNPEHIKRLCSTNNPNKSELMLDALIQKILPGEYKINTNGEVLVLGGKIPDFVNVNGQKKVIEFNGEPWHIDKSREEEREKLFRSLGWKMLTIWYKEMKDQKKVEEKIVLFNKGLKKLTKHINRGNEKF
jgi:very-short-patch-repair endonuclease